jgi:ABC-2 type transport system ATP-binding protein
MALLHNPEVLILDEPFEGIDPVSSETIRHLLHTISRRGVTVLLSSHILSLVDRISDRLLFLRAGRLVLNSLTPDLLSTVEQLYFDLVESPVLQDLTWLQSRP